MTDAFPHGQEVMVFDRRGNYEGRGRVQGVHQTNPWHYDVMPNGQKSLKAMKPGIPHSQLRPIGRSILAYERRENKPRMIKDEA